MEKVTEVIIKYAIVLWNLDWDVRRLIHLVLEADAKLSLVFLLWPHTEKNTTGNSIRPIKYFNVQNI